VLERAGDVGGTWRENIYPGCQCDVPSNLYSYSFDPRADWNRTFSPQPDIWEYLRGCVKRHGLEAHLRLNTPVTALTWDEDRDRWQLDTPDGGLTADFVIAATGALSSPALPKLDGLEAFTGKAFHSARWDPSCELDGARVAVVGTGASAIQIIPEVQRRARELHVYQRTAAWILPHPDRAVSGLERALYRTLPAVQRWVRTAIYWGRELFVVGLRHPSLLGPLEHVANRHRERQVADPAMRAALQPRYRLGCKRVLLSNAYYPALGAANVTLVNSGAQAVTATGIVDGDGVERAVDVIVFATGFAVTDSPGTRRIRGRGGRTLAATWNGSPHAYNGTTIAGFPNFAMLLGPHTGLGHSSVLVMIEAQINYVVALLALAEREGIATLEPRAEAQAAFVASVRARARGTVWQTGGCESWYLDAAGNTVLWPDFSWQFVRRLRRVELSDYVARPAQGDAAGYSSPA
jgi:cation diffusion facilitator CzcD-associated flavoprotein CzcO